MDLILYNLLYEHFSKQLDLKDCIKLLQYKNIIKHTIRPSILFYIQLLDFSLRIINVHRGSAVKFALGNPVLTDKSRS